ncbi:amidase [Pseudodonghicola flavimaris]|uniref:Amidase n=1 Tax=Pseudodonghicola flavimaris TaxID=3050036 RepID=A0ABT7F1A3_9RHOB|nr:amidase [Pseudodonghicola flavimaris]MDK3018382.1 amidase [Pseudodonghicola flavimaris]
MTEMHWCPAWQLRSEILAGKRTAESVTRQLLERIRARDGAIHSFITLADDLAIEEARAVDAGLAAGEAPGPLAGVPVTIKDQFFTKGLRTTGGSRTLEHHVPVEDSIYAARIRAAGGVILGKTNTPEFGMYWRTVGYVAPECRNPWDLSRTAGGSSGGAAAALASGFGPLAIGSDAGGSIRLPSAQCGVFGLLPSRGRVPRHGGFGSTLFFSAIGPMARDVRDAATLLQVIAGPMEGDPLCRRDAPPDYLATLEEGIAGVRAAWWHNTVAEGFADPEVVATVRAAANRVTEAGARLAPREVVLETDGIDEAWKVLDFVDRQANLGEALMQDPEKREQLTPYARSRFDWAAGVSGTEYSRALLRRAQIIRHLEDVFADTDLLLAPTIGIVSPVVDPTDLTLRIPALVSYTLPVNMAGYCAASVPCGFVHGLPVGLQIIGRPNEEALVLRAARQFEKMLGWAARHPETAMS